MATTYTDLIADVRRQIRTVSLEEIKHRLESKAPMVLVDVREGRVTVWSRTERDVTAAFPELDALGVRVLGCVLNRARQSRRSTGYGGYAPYVTFPTPSGSGSGESRDG